MPFYAFVVLAFSPRDGGWVRVDLIAPYFLSEEDAWNAVILFWELMVLHGDYITVDVRRTVIFGMAHHWVPQ